MLQIWPESSWLPKVDPGAEVPFDQIPQPQVFNKGKNQLEGALVHVLGIVRVQAAEIHSVSAPHLLGIF